MMGTQNATFELAIDGHDLDVETIAQAARCPGRFHFTLDAAAAGRVAASAALRQKLVDSGAAIYGVTTGFGDSAYSQISPDLAADLQHNLIRYHLNGTGADTPAEVVRAMILIRANCLARGVSGVRIEVIDLLLNLLTHDILPIIPERGSVGASGDLVPSCYLANVLVGEGEVLHKTQRRPAAEVLREHGLTPLRLEPKEGLALINGTSFMTAYAALAIKDAAEIAYVADLCTALASQVLHGYPRHFAEFLTRHKPHPGQITSAATVAQLLQGSKLSTEPAEQDALSAGTSRRLERQIQDRYSVRCGPHIVGVLRDTLEWAQRWVNIEINSATDNPLFDVETGLVHSGGNFYGGHLAQAMDSLKVAVANIADLLDRQLALIVDEKFSNGLPANLVPTHEAAGTALHHGYKGMQIACSAFTAEALKLASPASVFSRSTESHNQDKVSMGAIAARDARTIGELTESVAAVHLHALCQAADLRGAELLSPSTHRAYDALRAQVRFVEADRRLDDDLKRLILLIRSGALREASAKSTIDRVPDQRHPESPVIGGWAAGHCEIGSA